MSETAQPAQAPHTTSLPPNRFTPRRQVLSLFLLILAAYPLALPGYFYGDDAVILTDAAAVLSDPAAGFAPGTFGRFRPLRLFSIAPLYALFGTHTAIPYHFLSLGIHLLNMFLTYRLLHRLLPASSDAVTRLVPFAATALAAVHCGGSEAVTYLSAIGILISTTGALVSCLAVRNLAQSPPNRFPVLPLLQLAAGMLITIGGGYVLPTLAAALVCALWPREQASLRSPRQTFLLTAALLLPLTLAWALLEKLMIVRNFSQQARFDPLFMLHQLGESLARLYLPSAFINEPIVLAILAAAALAVAAFKPLRDTFRQSHISLLLLLSIATLLPYAPSALGNRDRFCYLPAPFFMALLLLLTVGSLRRWPRTPPALAPARVLWACLLLFLAIHLAALQLRVASANRRGNALRHFITQVASFKSDAPTLRLFFTTPDPEQGLFLLHLTGTLSPRQTLHAPPPAPAPPPGERWLIASYHLRTGFNVRPLPEPNQ